MNKSVTLVFPGQGTQYVGMGSSLREDPSFNLFEKANQSLGYDIRNIMLKGPEKELTLTANTQPAILAYSMALYEKLKREILDKRNIKVDRVLGHSVGEYAALVAAESLSFEDALRAVNLRGTYMQEAVPPGKGKMVAILKVPKEKVERACRECSLPESKVMPANFNEPNQIVVSGEAKACERLLEWLKNHNTDPYKAIELKVSAPFHSTLMEPAAKKLALHFKTLKFFPNKLPYIANIDAQEYPPHTDESIIEKNLIKQVAGSVCWTQSIASLPDETLCLEVGPGRVLMGLIRKINRNIKVISLDREEAFHELEEFL